MRLIEYSLRRGDIGEKRISYADFSIILYSVPKENRFAQKIGADNAPISAMLSYFFTFRK
ncbi:MAG: hypothetical protein A3E07_00515 [Candidatus Wildermuthbacteria bacterium RIFCSPHIGHO2_12_FULL_45_9]|nr:MAG: hypothetical protein A3E07_00515 [Candidatus Wildermuthbacteria bacterium RIFCSPHIGHO2_12_FULL_45_9]